METLQSFMTFLLILVPLGAALRIVLCLGYMSACQEEHEAAAYKKKALNALKYAVLAEGVSAILTIVINYFGGNVVFG